VKNCWCRYYSKTNKKFKTLTAKTSSLFGSKMAKIRRPNTPVLLKKKLMIDQPKGHAKLVL
jgi:hypothetical protein